MSDEYSSPQLQQWVGGKNCNVLVINQEGRWFYNSKDITNDAASIRLAFKTFIASLNASQQKKPTTPFFFEDRQLQSLAHSFVERIKSEAGFAEPERVNKPVKLYQIHLTPPQQPKT